MKTTRVLKLKNTDNNFKNQLNNLMREFCAAKRFAYNRLLDDGLNQNKTNKLIQQTFQLNKRYAEDATIQAKAIIDSQKKLLPLHLEEVQRKIKKTKTKIEDYREGKKKPKKVDLETCLTGLNARLEKLQQKESELESYIENDTIPRAIFGGKKNFYDRMEGKITNEEWKDLRTNQLYSRGDKTKKGNLNTRIVDQGNSFYLEIADSLNMKRNGRNTRIKAEIEIPDKYFNEIMDVIYSNNKLHKSYSIEIKRKNGEYYVYLTYEEEVSGIQLKSKQLITASKIAGIDINIDRIAVNILSSQGNFLKSRVFCCHELEFVSSNKRNNIVGEMAKDIIDFLLEENVGAIVTEKLNFKNDHDTNKKFNRLTHNFTRKKMLQALIRRGFRNGFQIKQVNPAYTSVIGRFKYAEKYGLSVHEAAALVIGRRGLGFKEKLPKVLIEKLKKEVISYLETHLGSREESEKAVKYFKDVIKKIRNFKHYHDWTLWNIVNKLLELRLCEYKLKTKEVKT